MVFPQEAFSCVSTCFLPNSPFVTPVSLQNQDSERIAYWTMNASVFSCKSTFLICSLCAKNLSLLLFLSNCLNQQNKLMHFSLTHSTSYSYVDQEERDLIHKWNEFDSLILIPPECLSALQLRNPFWNEWQTLFRKKYSLDGISRGLNFSTEIRIRTVWGKLYSTVPYNPTASVASASLPLPVMSLHLKK